MSGHTTSGPSNIGPESSDPGRIDNVGLVTAPFIGGLAYFILWERLPPGLGQASTALYFTLFLSFIGAVTYFAYRVTASWRSPERDASRLIRPAVVVTLVLAALVYVARPADESLGRRACQFGIGGIAKGTVWFKVAPPAAINEASPADYKIDVVWGAAEHHQTYSLRGPTYFTFQQKSLRAPGADISVDPPNALVSCGAGRPPRGETRIDITGTDWDVRG